MTVVQRHLHLQRELHRSAALQCGGQSAQPVAHRAGVGKANEILERPICASVYMQLLIVMQQIRNDGLDGRQRHAINPGLIRCHLHHFVPEHHARLDALDARPARHIINHRILDLRIDDKPPTPLIKRKFCQVALQGQQHVIGIAETTASRVQLTVLSPIFFGR